MTDHSDAITAWMDPDRSGEGDMPHPAGELEPTPKAGVMARVNALAGFVIVSPIGAVIMSPSTETGTVVGGTT